jgi:hypothetical protein
MTRRAVGPVVIDARYDDGRRIAGPLAAGVFAPVLVLLGRTDWTPLAEYPLASVLLPSDPFTSAPSRQP